MTLMQSTLVLAGVLVASLSVASAETVTIVERDFEFQPPDGYCLLDRSDEFESQILDYMAGMQRANNAELLAFFAACGEAAAIVEGSASNFFHYGMLVALPADGKTIAPVDGYDRPRMLTEMQVALPRIKEREDIARTREAVQQQLAEAGIDMVEVREPHVIGVDGNALYTAYSLEVDAGQGPAPVATVTAFTFLKEMPLATHLYAPGGDGAYADLFDIQSGLMKGFVAANEPAE